MPVAAAERALDPAQGPALDPWWARLTEPGGSCLVAVVSGDFPPGTVVDLPGGRRPPGWRLAVVSDDRRPVAVDVALPGAPLLWYVELPEPAGAPAATTLVAFSDARYADGRLLDADDARAVGIAADGQVGALRWWPGTGLVHQVYVSPDHRRRGVAHKLVRAAFGLQAARALPPLHGDGRRTDLGEQWRRSLPEVVATRMAAWSQRLPAMDPA
jgi:GNAT superfamily N-acetyltransferase